MQTEFCQSSNLCYMQSAVDNINTATDRHSLQPDRHQHQQTTGPHVRHKHPDCHGHSAGNTKLP